MQLTKIKKILNSHKSELSELGVLTLALFGSVIRNENDLKSDIDILIDFDSKKGMFIFVDLKQYLESLLQCEVDLVTKNALHPALKRKILQEANRVF